MPVVKFRQLVADVYLARGESTFEALHTIRREMGRNVAMSCLRAAYYGTELKVKSAKKFLLWAQEFHPKLTLDYDALISAPPAPRPRRRFAAPLTWTKERPTVPGFYFVPAADGVLVVCVGRCDNDSSSLPCAGQYSPVSVDEIEAWAGPIPEPEEPC